MKVQILKRKQVKVKKKSTGRTKTKVQEVQKKIRKILEEK